MSSRLDWCGWGIGKPFDSRRGRRRHRYRPIRRFARCPAGARVVEIPTTTDASTPPTEPDRVKPKPSLPWYRNLRPTRPNLDPIVSPSPIFRRVGSSDARASSASPIPIRSPGRRSLGVPTSSSHVRWNVPSFCRLRRRRSFNPANLSLLFLLPFVLGSRALRPSQRALFLPPTRGRPTTVPPQNLPFALQRA